MQYGWRSYRFDLPDGLEDESVLAFLARDDDKVDVNVVVAREELKGAFPAYLASAVDELRKSLSAYKLVSQSDRRLAGQAAKILEHSATSPEGETLCQMQAYIPQGQEVVIVTATGRSASRPRIEAMFEKIVGSFRAA